MRTMWQRVLYDESGQSLLAAIPAVSSILGGLFGKKKSGDTVQTTPSWLTLLQKQLGDWSSKALSDYTPGAAYGGDLNFAGTPTSQEQTGLSQLSSFLGSPGTGGLFDQASGQISDTLSGKFANPATSPFIQAMMKMGQNQLTDQITQERGMRGARGTYYTDAGVNAESKLQGRTMDNLNSIIGQFTQQERQNMLGAAGTAANLDQYKNMTLPLAKIGASQQYGSLSRLINQANLESQYQDYLRQRGELQGGVDVATKLATNQQNITPGQVQTAPGNNQFGDIMSMIPQIMKLFGH